MCSEFSTLSAFTCSELGISVPKGGHMKRKIGVGLIVVLSLFVQASSLQNKQVQSKPAEICAGFVDGAFDIERSGCCSHHNGVCGCNQALDKIACCDGTLSPSCTCSGY